jgi:hypothetical protein
MPKYAFAWWAGVSGNYVIEAEDAEAAADIWNEITSDQIIAQGYELHDWDSYGVKELP